MDRWMDGRLRDKTGGAAQWEMIQAHNLEVDRHLRSSDDGRETATGLYSTV